MKKQFIKNIILGIKEYYNTKDVYELIETLGITIIRKKLCNNIKAKTLRNIYGDEFIFLSEDIKEYEEKFILAHELGHLILHKEVSCCYYKNSFINKDKLEFEANYFAMELIFPDNIDLYEIEGFSIEQLSNIYGVPTEILKYKI